MDLENLDDIWKKYANSYFLFTPIFQQTLLENVGKNMSGIVLDAGCGVGKLVSRIESYSKYVGIDSNLSMIEVAKNKLKCKENISFELGDVCKINYSEAYFDSAASVNVLYSLNEPLKFIEEIYRVLKPNGRFILASPNRSLDMSFLEKKLMEEFSSNLDENLRNEFQSYLEINRQLAKGLSKSKYSPKLFDEDEIVKILLENGFKIEKKEKAYFDQLFHITSQKI